MNKNTYFAIGHIIQALKAAYVASCKGLKLANKLKSAKDKSRIMSRMNRIRSELKKWEKLVADAFTSVKYDGLVISLLVKNSFNVFENNPCNQN